LDSIDDSRRDEEAEAPRQPRRYGFAAKLAVLGLAALLVGGGVAYARNHGSSSTAGSGDSTAALDGLHAAGPGRIAGEQHISGTVTAKTTSTVTVKSSGGAATYTVNATTQIIRNGQAATLAAVQVGDPVFVHVYSSASGQMLVERLFAGSSASGGTSAHDGSANT
jgi:hypothetical protein